MAGGFRFSEYDPDIDPEYGVALQRYAATQDQAQAPSQPMPMLPDTSMPERRRIQGPTLDLTQPSPLPDLPSQTQPRDDMLAMLFKNRPDVARKMMPPQSAPSTRGPMVSAPAKAAVPRGPKTQLALHFARVMGMEAPGEVDSPEELAFAKAAHAAMVKMSKGQSVSKFLSSMNSAKASATFRQLLDAEMAKGKPPAVPVTGASR